MSEYTRIDPSCPACGSSSLEGSGEDPSGLDGHLVHATCTECGAYLTIEMSAIDVQLHTPEGGTESGVARGDIDVRTHEYPDAE